MGALVLQYHPLVNSLSTALLDATIDGLRAAGQLPRVIRIENTPESVAEQDRHRLSAGEFDGVRHLILVYPTWWGGLPARLLQVFGDLLSPYVDGDADPSESPLRSIEYITVVTTHGSSKLINRVQGEPGLRMWTHTVVPLCATNCTFEWRSLYGVDNCGVEDRLAFVESTRTGLKTARC